MMSQDRDVIRMRHVLDAARKAISYVAGKSRNDLDRDEVHSLVLARLVEIIGEAASKVTEEMQSRYPPIEWRDIVGTRNRLIHAYEAVSRDILWQIVSVDLAELIVKLQKAIEQESSNQPRETF